MSKLYVAAAILTLLGLLAWSIHHDGYQSRGADDAKIIATAKADTQTAIDTNVAGESALKAALFSAQTCALDRALDANAQSNALAVRAKVTASLQTKYSAARARLDALLNTTCKTWAQLPACTDVQSPE